MSQSGEQEQDGRIRVQVDPDIADLVPGFLANRGKDVELIRAALDEGDLETARTRGHSMKGSGGGYGFPTISEIGAVIEEASRAGDTSTVRREIDRLADYLARVDVVEE